MRRRAHTSGKSGKSKGRTLSSQGTIEVANQLSYVLEKEGEYSKIDLGWKYIFSHHPTNSIYNKVKVPSTS